MESIRQYTTPTVQLEVEKVLIADKDVRVTFTFSNEAYQTEVITFGNDEITMTEDEANTFIDVPFTQEQTALFRSGSIISIQVNWLNNGKRCATDTAYINVTEKLLKEIWE